MSLEPSPVKPVDNSNFVFDAKAAGEIRKDNELKMNLVWCPPGKFTMGSPKNEKDRYDDGREEQVSVTLNQGFWLGQTSVTQSQYKTVMDSEPWKGKLNVKERENMPATFVNSICLPMLSASMPVAPARQPRIIMATIPTN